MKIIKILLFTIVAHKIISTVVLEEKENGVIPESNKLQIKLNRGGDPILVSSHNFIEKLKSEVGQVQLHTPFQEEKEGLSAADVEEHPDPDDIETIMDSDPLEDKIVHIKREQEDKLDRIKAAKDEQQRLIHEIGEIMVEHQQGIPKTHQQKQLKIAYNQMDELEEDLTHAFHDQHVHPTLLDPKVLKSTVAYLEHIDYVHSKELGAKEHLKPPKLPEFYRTPQKAYYSTELEVNPEANSIPTLEQRVHDLKKELEELKQEHYENNPEKRELSLDEENNIQNEISNTEEMISDIKTDEMVKEDLEEIEEAEENLDKNKPEDQTTEYELNKEKQHMEEQEIKLIESIKILDEISKLDKRIAEIDQELLELEVNGIQENVIEDLNAEKKILEEKKSILIMEGKIQRKHTPEELEAMKIKKIGYSGQMAKVANNNDYGGSASSYKNIPNLLVVIQNISAAYNTLFNDLPNKSEELPKDSLTQLREGLQLYAKLRNFIVAVTVNKNDLKNDIIHVKDNLESIKLSKDEVLGFYDLKDKYDNARMKVKVSDINFIEKESLIRDYTAQFSENIHFLVKDINTLLNLDDVIYQETDYLRQNMDDDETLDAIKKVDATLLLLPKMIDLKVEVDLTISELQTQLNNLTSKRSNLTTVVDDIEKISNGEYIRPIPDHRIEETFKITFVTFLTLFVYMI
jgi:hypothetical protein